MTQFTDEWMYTSQRLSELTHWGRVTHICVGKLAINGSDNGLSPRRRQAIIWTNAGILLIGPLGTNFSEILIEIQTFSLKKIRLKMSSAKCCSFRLGLNVLRHYMWGTEDWASCIRTDFNANCCDPFHNLTHFCPHKKGEKLCSVTVWMFQCTRPCFCTAYSALLGTAPYGGELAGPRLNIKIIFSRYGDSHVEDETVARPS